MNEPLIYFNGVDVDTGHYFRPAVTPARFLEGVCLPSRLDPLLPRDPASWVDSRKLDQTGWGLIVHEREGPGVREALAPLLQLRRQQAGARFRILTFTDEHERAAESFFEEFKLTRSVVDPEQLPYYLTIIGSPERIPYEFQYELDVTHAVGRICFEKERDYADYAEKIVAAERRELPVEATLVLFASENDELTVLCGKHLIEPLGQKLNTVIPGWRIELCTGALADKARLEKLMGGPDTPAVLFTCGHGLMASKDAQRRSREQGSLICSDWHGPGTALKRSHYFGPDDVDPRMDAAGSVFFHFACFSAGTPEFDAFRLPRKSRRFHEKPFVSPLAQRLLAHQKGPQAIVGHVDQAFQSSFLWKGGLEEISHFASAFFRLTQGYPVGAAMEPFNRRFAVIGSEIAAGLMGRAASEATILNYWQSYHDARNYLVLGDPAVRVRSDAVIGGHS